MPPHQPASGSVEKPKSARTRTAAPSRAKKPDAAAPPAARTKRTAAAAKPRAGGAPRAAAEPKSKPKHLEQGKGGLHVVMVASEVHPFATSGGLAEVVGSLSQAVARLGHRVTIVMPRYARTTLPALPHRSEPATNNQTILDFGARRQTVGFTEHPVSPGLTAVFVEAPDLYHRDGLYGSSDGDYPDNAYRFAVLSRATLEFLRLRGDRPSVIHAHDWQTGLVPAYQKMLFSDDPIVGRVPVVFTIHNLAFQGIFPAATLNEIGLPWEVFNVRAMEFWGQISYLKAGINFSERVTTVSPGYAREALTAEMGFGFNGVLAARADDFTGILNGIDTDRWNPATDSFLPAHYTLEDLSGKREAKKFLLQSVGLPASPESIERPLIGVVSRLTDQKGFDLFAAATDELMALDAAWVMLGSGERRYEELWSALAARYPDRVSTTIGYDERLEHLIEAGADTFLMPSHFEPCGLNQLNSLRYGTPPIVRATGGLDDTVEDVDPVNGKGTGFKFADYTPGALVEAVRRALDVYRNRAVWQQMQRNAMKRDYSWDVSAREYVKVYSAIS